MKIHHKLLQFSFPFFCIKNYTQSILNNTSNNPLRVLIYHDIPDSLFGNFSQQINWLQKSWKILSPKEFVQCISGENAIDAPSLLLTFDDGFSSNRRIAEQILNPLGIQALYFIISEFAELNSKAECHSFVSSHIWPGMPENEVPDHWTNMNWDDLSFLLSSGHTIGAHTAHHARLSNLSPEMLNVEIVQSADKLKRKLGTRIDHFAYTFGDLASFNSVALEIARSCFPYIYTGLRGNNCKGVHPWAIRRDAVQASDSLSLVGAYLQGGVDFLYSRSLKTYESWGMN